MLLYATANALSLAVLPFEGRGLDGASAERATDALRDSLLAEGIDSPGGSVLADSLARGQEGSLRTARAQAGVARSALERGQTAAALAAAQDSLAAHEIAGSRLTRPGEVADVRYLLADALLRSGDSLGARRELEALARGWGEWSTTRGRASGAAARMLTEIEVGTAKEAGAPPAQDDVLRVLDASGAAWVAFGVVYGSGRVVVWMYDRDGGPEAVSANVAVPIDAQDEAWGLLARGMADRARSFAPEAVGAMAGDEPAAPPPPPPQNAPPEPEPLVVSKPVREATERPVKEPEVRERPVKIREAGAIRYDDRPVTSRWWFWTLVAGVVAGSTATGWALSRPPIERTVTEPDAWTLSVEAE